MHLRRCITGKPPKAIQNLMRYIASILNGRPLPNARDSNEYVAVVAKKETKAVKESSEDVAMGVGKGESTTRRAAVSPMQMPKQMACQLRCPWRVPRQLVSGGIWRGKCAQATYPQPLLARKLEQLIHFPILMHDQSPSRGCSHHKRRF